MGELSNLQKMHALFLVDEQIRASEPEASPTAKTNLSELREILKTASLLVGDERNVPTKL